MPAESQRLSKRFSWDAVPSWVIKGMLEHAYRSSGQDDQLEQVDRLTKAQLPVQARRVLGEPPKPGYFNGAMCDWLRRQWLPKAKEDVVVSLTQMVQAGLAGEERRRKFRTKSGRVTFLAERRLTPNFCTNLRKSFVAAHKVDGVAVTPAGGSKPGAAAWIPLVGEGAPSRNRPYTHQVQARAALDGAPSPVRGVIVLPTGAGKTDTVAVWLLRQMAQDEEVRVLWVAHQQALVDQALRRFQALARELPPGFDRRARAIHSAGSAGSTLGETELDVAGITVQTLGKLLAKNQRTIARFLGRPTFVVVDEAHHAGSPTYTQLLTHLGGDPNCRGIIGLTATPYPSSAPAFARFLEFFPQTLADVRREDLIADRVLARPRLHIVDTGTTVHLSGTERDQAVAYDLPPSALALVAGAERDALIVGTWRRAAQDWGKTLVFATGIAHADQLHQLFQQAKVAARVLHSQTENRSEVLEWFRTITKPCVLVSVGMLTEGVDLPDARTAFLARPTTSRILLQQMIGRVLRGPKAGGDPDANLVYLRDQWANFGDVLEPPEVIEVGPVEGPSTSGALLPPIRLDSGTEVPPEVAATVQRLVDQARRSAVLDDDDPSNDRSLDPQLTLSSLAGYYDLGGQAVPVFEHQLDGFRSLIRNAGESFQGFALLAHFEGQPTPFPTRRAVRDLVDYVREFGEPPFVELDAPLGVEGAAAAVMAAGPLTPERRRTLIREHFDGSLNRSVWASFDHFEQEVDNQIRRAVSGRGSSDRERPLVRGPVGVERLPRRKRPLAPIVQRAVNEACRILPPEHADRLDAPPPVYWTQRVVASTWGHWTIALGKTGAGRQQIRINRLLRTESRHFPDEAVAYLVYHELLHHLLPGQGHDAEFVRLEQLWPDADALDRLFDTLHETWDTDPASYTRDVGGRRDTE